MRKKKGPSLCKRVRGATDTLQGPLHTLAPYNPRRVLTAKCRTQLKSKYGDQKRSLLRGHLLGGSRGCLWKQSALGKVAIEARSVDEKICAR